MRIYIDSAQESEARLVKDWGWISGITTNPTLMAQAGRRANVTLERLSALGYNELFYQLVSQDWDAMIREAQTAEKIVGKALVLKVPPNELGFRFVANHQKKYNCCVTAIYHPAQALVARAAGARYLAVYVNRSTRLLGDGNELVRNIAKTLAGGDTEMLAASLKSIDETTAALMAGAHHLTLSLAILKELPNQALSIDTINQFNTTGLGLDIK